MPMKQQRLSLRSRKAYHPITTYDWPHDSILDTHVKPTTKDWMLIQRNGRVARKDVVFGWPGESRLGARYVSTCRNPASEFQDGNKLCLLKRSEARFVWSSLSLFKSKRAKDHATI